MQERIAHKIASGELTREQERCAKHTLRELEALQEEFEVRLARARDLRREVQPLTTWIRDQTTHV